MSEREDIYTSSHEQKTGKNIYASADKKDEYTKADRALSSDEYIKADRALPSDEYTKVDRALSSDEHMKKLELFLDILQKEPSPEALAAALSAVRRAAKAGSELIVGTGIKGAGQITMKTITGNDGNEYFIAFTSFEEELKGSDPVMSAFTSPLEKILKMALDEPAVSGLIIDPWNLTLTLDKKYIALILAK
ncbi:MAG: SseB family protein [Lachnospiraceae bacterium]|jgi:hypothetical protein|nr:SseB family protein [Lachnospiraceae bacterium]